MSIFKNYSKEFKVGLLTLVSGVLLYFGFNYLKGLNVFENSHEYYTVFNNTEGLQVSNAVMVSGVPVGQVTNITLAALDSGKILVAFSVNQDIPLGKETEVVMAEASMLGGKMLKLNIKGSEKAEDGFTFKSTIEKGIFALATEKASPVVDSVQITIALLNQILRDFSGTSDNMRKALDNASAMTANANQIMMSNKQSINNTLKNFETLSASLVKTEAELKPLLSKFNRMADSLNSAPIAQVTKDLDKTLQETQKALIAINEAKGTMGKFVHDPSVYKNLNQSLSDLDSLLVDFRKKPKRYVHFSVFGKKDKEEKKKGK
jgi:phospholipid/cholesterol/gamma-HCH transport system substrate-binding protein